MACGIVIVDKPSGWTSQDVVSKLRGVFHERHVGHGGTLDPMATGVLPVFVGRATRAAEFLESAEKTYEAVLRLGVVTDTQDTEGQVLSQTDAAVTDEQLRHALTQFIGEIEQIPPMYSAVKIGGKKLYELARKGQTVERRPRKITVFSLELLDRTENDCRLKIHCSKGTYVRTLCHDIGAVLGCGGTMAALRRTQAGSFGLEQAVSLETLVQADDPARYLLPIDSLFAGYPEATLTGEYLRLCRNGNVLPWKQGGRFWRIYAPNGEFLMLGRHENGRLYTEKSFFEVT